MDFNLDFQPYQVVVLELRAFESGASRVYAEVIQVVEQRQICWARPLVLQLLPQRTPLWSESSALELYDLRQGVDLLCPIHFFRAAIDTEVLPVLAQLYTLESSLEELRIAQQKLKEFMGDLGQLSSPTQRRVV